MSQIPPSEDLYIKKPHKKKWPWILGIIAAFLLILLIGGAVTIGGATQRDYLTAARTIELKATTTGTGKVLHGEAGIVGTDHFQGKWSKTFKDAPNKEKYTLDGYVLTVTGDITDPNSKVTCQILVDGKIEQEATAIGDEDGASCIIDAKFF